MRTSIKLTLFTFLLIAAAISACKKDNLTPSVPSINIIAKVVYDTTNGNYSFPIAGIKVTVKNTVTGYELTQNTDNNGLAIFNSSSAGIYDLQAVISISKQQYENLTGLSTDKDSITLNAALNNLSLNNSTNNTIELKLQTGKIGDWVIKQIYYAGSSTTNGAMYRDQFIEIYNNSNNVLYADSLYISQLYGSNTSLGSVDLSKGYFISEASDVLYKQFDWSKSLNMPAALGDKANKNYVYAKTLFRVPGTGKQYPVQPGESFVIAATAQNHKMPFVGTNDKPVTVKDPSLTVDLSNADFEVYIGDVISNPLTTDVDNPNVTNMLAIYTANNRDFLLDNPGRDAIAIFKTTSRLPVLTKTGAEPEDVSTYPKFPSPDETSISSKTYLYYQIPNNIIIDAVQIQSSSPTSSQRVARKLIGTLDAGATNVPDGAYSSQSVIRKTAKKIGDRRILMDTNNSTNDFDYLPNALPKVFKD